MIGGFPLHFNSWFAVLSQIPSPLIFSWTGMEGYIACFFPLKILCMHMHMEVRSGLRLLPQYISTLVFETGHQQCPDFPRLAGKKMPGIQLSLPTPTYEYRCMLAVWLFRGVEHLNSSPQAYTASTSLTEPSKLHFSLLFF